MESADVHSMIVRDPAFPVVDARRTYVSTRLRNPCGESL